MIRFGPSSLMANYSKIKRVIPLRSHLAMAVGENWKIEGWEGIEEVRGRTRKLRREVVGRLDERSMHENKTTQGCRGARGLTTMRVRVPGVGLEGQGVVSRCSGGAPYHHCGLARIGNSEVFFISLSLLSLCFVIIIKYSRAQKGMQASHPHHHSLSVALELNGYF